MAETNVLEDPGFEVNAPSPKKYRVQLDFGEHDFEEINLLVKKLGVSTRAELFRSALITLRWMSQKKMQGCTIVAMSPDHERLIEPEFSFLSNLDREKSSEMGGA